MALSKFKIPEEIELIRKYYYDDSLSSVEISRKFKCSHNTICRTLIRRGFKLRAKSKHTHKKYSINENYFNLIDSFDKAYFLGLLYADGTLSFKDKLVSIGLQSCDGYIIDKLIAYTNFSGISRESEFNNPKHQNKIYVQIYNEYFYQNAINCGLFPNKSTSLLFPNNNVVPVNLLSHFIRGFFDGDGCAFIDKKRKAKKITMVSTFEFLEELQQILINTLNIRKTKITPKNKKSNTYQLNINSQIDIKKVSEYMYQDKNDLYLIRKYLKLTQ